MAIVALWLPRKRLNTAQWARALLFLALHTIAARWIYSFVPYDDWTDAVFGVRLSEAFSWERNHFDRLAPQVAEAYNGQQGDMWDAHADMALAALGALVTSLASYARRRSPTATTR